MTNQHPLTDEICDEIQESIYVIDPFESSNWCDPSNMRGAADWQLEQVIKWIEDENTFAAFIYDHAASDGDYGVQTYVSEFIAHLKKAMRPQQQETTHD